MSKNFLDGDLGLVDVLVVDLDPKKFLDRDPGPVDAIGVGLDLKEVLGRRSWSCGCSGRRS